MSIDSVRIGNTTLQAGSIVIQSMTDTDTANVDTTVQQILELHKAGSEMVRITVDRPESAIAVPHIIKNVRIKSDIPIIGDFHFNGHLLIPQYPEMAKALDKWRINPGNIGKGNKKDEHFETIITKAIEYKKPIRIGVNGGSLDQELLEIEMNNNSDRTSEEILVNTMVKSALLSAKKAEALGLPHNQIVLSVKHSSVPLMIEAYRTLRKKCNYALHLGLTEAGSGNMGIISSSIALGVLLQENIGETIRVSITPKPGESRIKEVEVAKNILQALGKKQFSAKIVSCPGCGRTAGNEFQVLTERLTRRLQQPQYKHLHVAVMGCRVNGVGEAKDADIGIFFPGQGEGKQAVISRKNNEDILINGDLQEIEERFWEEAEKLTP